MKVERAFRDGQGVQVGSTVATIAYDGLGRRIVMAIEHCADLPAGRQAGTAPTTTTTTVGG